MDPVKSGDEVVLSGDSSDTDFEPEPKRFKLEEEGPSVRLISPGTLSPVKTPESGSDYFDSDFDIDEIPSDWEFSPPRSEPSPPCRRRATRSPDINSQRHRERRNAIFERRDPPPLNIQELELAAVYHNELEVASVSDINENPIEDVNSTSGSDSEVPVPVQDQVELPPEPNENSQDADSSQGIHSGSEKVEPLSDGTHRSSSKSKGGHSTDSEISEKDKWTCSMCHCRTEPFFRFCGRCFNMRRGWLPERPKSRKLKRRNRKKAQQRRTCRPFVLRRVTPVSSEGEDCVDGKIQEITAEMGEPTPTSSGCAGSMSDQTRTEKSRASAPIIVRSLPAQAPVNLNEAFVVDDNHPSLDRINSRTPPGNVTILNLELFAPPPPPTRPNASASSSGATTTTEVESSSAMSSQSLSQPLPSEPETFSQPMSTQSSTSDFMSPPDPRPSSSGFANEIPPSNQCNMCSVRVKNAVFVHSKTAHQYACYNCSKLILRRSGKCPVCREKVHRVVKVFIV